MKWEDYKKLSESERIFWDFNFNKKLEIPRSSIYYICMMMALFSVSLFTFYLIVSEKLDVGGSAMMQFRFMGQIVYMSLICWAIDYIGSWAYYFWINYKERKWLRGLKK